MANATINQILAQVDPDKPCSPDQFPDFDPEDREAWAYFIYVYLFHSDSDEWNPPLFLPACQRRGWSKQVVFTERLIVDPDPFRYVYSGDNDKINRLSCINRLLEYIDVLIKQWYYGYGARSEYKMGFYIKNRDRAIYEKLLKRASLARDIAWRKIMQYSGELLYTYSQPHTNSDVRAWKVQADNGEALILPRLALLFVKVNREWNQVFSQNLQISSGYRTYSQQKTLYDRLKEKEKKTGVKQHVALHSAHVCCSAIDVIPTPGLCQHFECGLNMFLGYIAWLFRRVARRESQAWVDVGYAGNVSRQAEEYNSAFEWAGMKLLSPIPYTIVEPGNRALHVSYIWLLRALGDADVRRERLPAFVRPYANDIPNPQGTEAKGPPAFNPYLDTFNVDTYKNDICRAKTTIGIAARWMYHFFKYQYPSQNEINIYNRAIEGIDQALSQTADSNVIDRMAKQREKLEQTVKAMIERRDKLVGVLDREQVIHSLGRQMNWGP